MLVRSPLLTINSHKWRELVSSGRLVCRCKDVFLWCYLCFVLLRFRLYTFVEAAALRSIVLRYAGAPIATHVFFFSLLFIRRCRVFRVFFVPLSFSLCTESMSYVLSFRMAFLYLVTTGWIFYISLLCEDSINQPIINQSSGANLYPPGECPAVIFPPCFVLLRCFLIAVSSVFCLFEDVAFSK